MKKFLSLVMALVMVMSLVTISAGAKEFTDSDSITYSEAIAVISEIGVVDGDTNGSFRPTDILTRQAAAKIICNLKLGPTTAAELHADTAPFSDVPTTSQFAGYIAYCAKLGIISGYGNGTFRPTAPLTGYAFMKMLLGALGYDAELEGYTGANWSINVAKQALGIGLNKGLEGEFNGLKSVTREEACLYAFRTLQADLVEYGSRITTTVGGQDITIANGGFTSRKWDSQQTRVNNIREDDIVQFAEEYFRKLEKKIGEDEFMRPAYTWIYDKEEIGTFVDWELLVEEYKEEVTGRDLYDLLTTSLLNDDRMDLTYYVNGVEPVSGSGLPAWVAATNGDDNITKDNNTLRRSNQNGVGITDNGVLTQVFVDKDVREEIIIVSIDTWLAEAGAEYNESKDSAPIEVWTGSPDGDHDNDSTTPDTTWNVESVDVPEVKDVQEDEFYLVTISWKDNLEKGEVVTIEEPEILNDSEVTKFTTKKDQVPSKVTTGGQEYKQAKRGYYDPKALYEYDETLLSDRSYNIILDPYGFMIGIELAEGTKNYVFITGFDRPRSNLSIQTADAAGIFLDGTMQTIKVNVSQTDKNIKRARTDDDLSNGKFYFIPWQDITTALSGGSYDGFYALNRWFTYTVNDSGVYTLKPATNMVIHNYGDGTNPVSETIKTANLHVDDNVMTSNNIPVTETTSTNWVAPYYGLNSTATSSAQIKNQFANASIGSDNAAADPDGTDTTYKYDVDAQNGERAYGNDDSVYITVDVGDVDTAMTQEGAITEVSGVYTGVQNVEIEIETAANGVITDRPLEEAEMYVVYDSDHYIIGAVTNGEAKGGNATIGYITSGVKSERIENGIYYWEFEAVVDGEVKLLTAKSKYDIFTNTIKDESNDIHEDVASYLFGDGATPIAANVADPGRFPEADSTKNWNAADGLVELRFDSDGYVISAKTVAEKDIYSFYGSRANGDKGNSSEVTASGGTTRVNTSLDLDDAKAYRIGGINDYMTDGALTWDNGSKYYHYDSAPTELTLRGRTLYVTPQTGTNTYEDEGLALQSDAKAVVIQRENGKWKTREFSSVSSAISQIVDIYPNVPGKQFSGEIVAAMGTNGAAKWVVFTSYANLLSGGGTTTGPNRVYNVAVEYVDETGGEGDEYIAFKLYGTTQGRSYVVTLQTSFAGVVTTRTKTVVGQSGSTSLYVGTSGNAAGFYGKLDRDTYITVSCEDGVGTYKVPSGSDPILTSTTLTP